MSCQLGLIDDCVKEYLLFRGFTSTLKSLEHDLKSEKDKSGSSGSRVDRIVDSFLAHVQNHDLNSLRELWNNLNSKVFLRISEIPLGSTLPKLESSLYKLYLIQALQSKETGKVREFFDKLSVDLQGNPEWKDWFPLPFIKNPEENPVFSLYFTRQWQDTLILSLHNFLAIVYSCLPLPRLAEYANTSVILRKLREDNDSMKKKLMKSVMKDEDPRVPPPDDVMDDFFIIAQEAASSSDNQVKNLKTFLKNLTTGNSGGGDKKIKPKPPQAKQTVRRVSQIASTPPPTSTALPPLPPPPTALVEPTPPIESNQNTSGRLAYLLLGQEEYSEHRSEITHCKFNTDGTVIASSDNDGVIKIWNPTPSPATLATFIGNSAVTALDWITDSERHFIYGTKSGTIRLCDKNDRSSVEFGGADENSSPIIHLTANHSSFAVSTTVDINGLGSLYLYDLKTAKIDRDLSQGIPIPMITCSAFNHNSQMIVVGGIDGKIRIFDLRRNDCISSWSTHDCTPISAIQMSSDENSIHAMTTEGHISRWSIVQTGSKLNEQMLEDPYFNRESYPRTAWGKTFALSNDGKHLLSCSISGGVIYEDSNGSFVKVLGLKGHKSHATCVDWSTANDVGPCVTADAHGHVRVSTLLSQ